MKSITSQWYEVKVRYDKMTDDGTPKPITEQYVVDALTFTEAESIITEEMSVYISGEFNINGIKPAPYKEIFSLNLTATIVGSRQSSSLSLSMKRHRRKSVLQ